MASVPSRNMPADTSRTCQKAVQRYIAATGQDLPPASAGTDARRRWLYASEWRCIAGGEIKSQADCRALVAANSDQLSEPVLRVDVSRRPIDVAPALRILQEDGFFAWVNDRSVRCINAITGRSRPFLPPGTDNKFAFVMAQPGIKVSYTGVNVPYEVAFPPTACQPVCQHPTAQSALCFHCIHEALVSPSPPALLDLCNHPIASLPVNGAYVRTSAGSNIAADATLMQDCMDCQSCLGRLGAHWDTDSFDLAWKCIDGSSVPSPWDIRVWPLPKLILLIVGVLLLVGAIIAIVIHFSLPNRSNLTAPRSDSS